MTECSKPMFHMPFRRFRSGGSLAGALSIGDLRAQAFRRLPAIASEYLEGGAEEEVSLDANRAIFSQYGFAPRLAPPPQEAVAHPIVGALPFPYVIAPTGLNGLFWCDADSCLAQAAAGAGVPFVQSTVSNEPVETVAANAGGGLIHWFQLYPFSDRAIDERLMERAWNAGCRTLVITVDAAIYGNREWSGRHYASETQMSFATKVDAMRHPRWMMQVYKPGLPGFPNLEEWLPAHQRDLLGAAGWIRTHMLPRIDWSHVAETCGLWKGHVLVKGLCHVDDSVRAIDAGAHGVVLGNHGGRQLDGALPGLALLPQVRARLGASACVMIEGGVRRGSDILKARLLGADAVMGGRATLYGVAAGGKEGAWRALAILKSEYERARALLGGGEIVDLNRVDRDSVPAHTPPARISSI